MDEKVDSLVRRMMEMSPRQRRKSKFGRKRGPYRKRDQRLSRQELLSHLTDNDIRSLNSLRNAGGSDAPTRYDYVREFGSWSEAKRIAFGQSASANEEPPCDPAYMAKLLIEFDAWKVRDYIAKRKQRPDIFPSYKRVRKMYGRFSDMVYFARRYSFAQKLLLFMRLRMRLGRWPTTRECRAENIDIKPVIDFYGSRERMIRFMTEVGGIADENE